MTLATHLDHILLTTHDKVRTAMHKWDKPGLPWPRIAMCALVFGVPVWALLIAALAMMP